MVGFIFNMRTPDKSENGRLMFKLTTSARKT